MLLCTRITIDDCTGYSHVYLFSHMLESLNGFRHYMNDMENQFDKSIRALRTGLEYLSEQFKALCEKKGIVRQ